MIDAMLVEDEILVTRTIGCDDDYAKLYKGHKL